MLTFRVRGLFAAPPQSGHFPKTPSRIGGWASWAVLNYQHDAADRYKGVSDIIVQSKVTAPMAESYDDYDP